MPPPLRVLVIADDPLARTGLGALLAGEAGLSVVGQVGGAQAPRDLDTFRPDVGLWDLGWGTGSVTDRLADLRESPYPVVALVTDEVQAGEAWAAGAKGVLARAAGAAALLAALQAAGQGLSVVGPDFRKALSQPRELPPAPLQEPLTAREMEVLALMAEGIANKVISHRLGISEHTVKFHVNSILGKLGAQSRTEAVTLAVRWGLVHL